jgi:hypothetical protein
MSYIIYKNISTEDFEMLHERIFVLRPLFESFLSLHRFKITNKGDLADILGLDFVSHGDRYNGNIGFLFEDSDSKEYTFNFYVLKSFDVNKKRYSNKEYILKQTTLEYIEKHSIALLHRSIELYNTMKDEELIKVTMLR